PRMKSTHDDWVSDDSSAERKISAAAYSAGAIRNINQRDRSFPIMKTGDFVACQMHHQRHIRSATFRAM
ncbi:hypothetical protein, partial [Bifidobacterium sp. UBA6881]|uniref:hypothetical protein n=1 Tax=Bifidobacterium sp. UBA6881 TaxID=1946109 RepID=UPI0025BBF176